MMKKFAYAGLTAAVVAATFLTAAPAQAAARDGICQSGEFCLYYNSDHAGSVSDFTGSIDDYGASQPECYEFKGAGAGQGQCVKNNAASVWNRTSGSVTVFYNSGYSGDSQTFASGAKVNLNATLKNDNASHRFGGGTSTNVDMSDALYVGGGGRITCGFDGYVNTPGRHEGIDIAKASGSTVKALLSGTVTNVVEGAVACPPSRSTTRPSTRRSSTCTPTPTTASTPATRSARAVDRRRGGPWCRQCVATPTSRCAWADKTLAAKSVDDPVLDNPNPNSFWQARGYNVR